MTSTPTVCPKCGESRDIVNPADFACGSDTLNGQVRQSDRCKLRVAESQLAPFQPFMDESPVTEDFLEELDWVSSIHSMRNVKYWVPDGSQFETPSTLPVYVEALACEGGWDFRILCFGHVIVNSAAKAGTLRGLIHFLGIKVPHER